MKLNYTTHSLERAKERRDGIDNDKDAKIFLRKKIEIILNGYKEGNSGIKKLCKDGKIKITSFGSMFVYKKLRDVYTIITYYDYHIGGLKDHINRVKFFLNKQTNIEVKKLHLIVQNNVQTL